MPPSGMVALSGTEYGCSSPAQHRLSPTPCTEMRKGPQEAKQLSKKEKKLKNSLSCPEPRKESKQPLLQMTLLLASCREAGVFITTTGAKGRAALWDPAPHSHSHGPMLAVVANAPGPCGAPGPHVPDTLGQAVPAPSRVQDGHAAGLSPL